MVAVIEAIAARRHGQTILEHSAVGEHNINGRVERAIRSIRAQGPTLRHFLERKLQVKVDVEATVMSWVWRWAAMLHSRYHVGADGRTAWERFRGRKLNQWIVGFGEKVWWRELEDSTETKILELFGANRFVPAYDYQYLNIERIGRQLRKIK